MTTRRVGPAINNYLFRRTNIQQQQQQQQQSLRFLGHSVSTSWRSSLGEGFFPQFLVGFSILWYFGLLPSPIPAIPPYLVKTHHIHGPWPIAATNSGSTPDEVLVNSRCLLADIHWSTTDNHIEDQRNHLLRNLILSSVAFVLLALLQDPSIVLVLSPCDRYCHNWPHPWPRLH